MKKNYFLAIIMIAMLFSVSCKDRRKQFSPSNYVGWAVAATDYVPGEVHVVGYDVSSVVVTVHVDGQRHDFIVSQCQAVFLGDSLYLENGKIRGIKSKNPNRTKE